MNEVNSQLESGDKRVTSQQIEPFLEENDPANSTL